MPQAESTKKDHLRQGSKVPGTVSALAGSLSGLTARFCTAPLDVVKIRLQLQVSGDKYHGILRTARTIVREEGLLALWKGNLPASAMYVIYGAVQFSTYSTYNTWLSEFQQKSNIKVSVPTHSFILGSLAGCTSTLVSYPFDLLRTRFASNTSFSKVEATVRDIIVHEGPLALFKGVNTAMLSISLYTGLLFWCYQTARLTAEMTHVPAGFIEPVCGLVAGAVAKGTVFPLDLIRRRLQVNRGKSEMFWKAGLRIVRNEGVSGLYKGFFVSLVKNAPTSALSIWTYEYAVRAMMKAKEMEEQL